MHFDEAEAEGCTETSAEAGVQSRHNNSTYLQS